MVSVGKWMYIPYNNCVPVLWTCSDSGRLYRWGLRAGACGSRPCSSQYTPDLLEGRAHLGTGQRSREGVVTDGHRLLCVIHIYLAAKTTKYTVYHQETKRYTERKKKNVCTNCMFFCAPDRTHDETTFDETVRTKGLIMVPHSRNARGFTDPPCFHRKGLTCASQ